MSVVKGKETQHAHTLTLTSTHMYLFLLHSIGMKPHLLKGVSLGITHFLILFHTPPLV
jgi:hypothetical protein